MSDPHNPYKIRTTPQSIEAIRGLIANDGEDVDPYLFEDIKVLVEEYDRVSGPISPLKKDEIYHSAEAALIKSIDEVDRICHLTVPQRRLVTAAISYAFYPFVKSCVDSPSSL